MYSVRRPSTATAVTRETGKTTIVERTTEMRDGGQIGQKRHTFKTITNSAHDALECWTHGGRGDACADADADDDRIQW